MGFYSSYEFKEFAKQYEFEIVTSSPLYPQSNGETERAVATMRKILEKSDDIYLGLQDNTHGNRLLPGRTDVWTPLENQRPSNQGKPPPAER
ncbi:hypothetical protein M513_13048 [Trichuris suis]|uniref:Integrase catalytic domain-containing protein n=1 Tax=Trichuris suis TaxID=68888 RepID=A0A085LM85_9BILA|nr:hypothetical protein M513_13048 [Trichuris suis]